MRACLCLMIAIMSAPAGLLAATVPFEVDSGRPMVSLTVNGRGPYPFVFDTGSPSLLVMQALVDELGLEVVGTTELGSPMGGTPIEAQRVRVDSIELGGATLTGLEAIALDLGSSGLGMGIVGPAVFREQGPLTLDFVNNTLTLGNGANSDGVATWIPFGKSAPILDVPLRIGELSIDGHIDTGSPGVLSVPMRFEDQLPLTGPVRTVGRGRTVDAEFEIRGAPIEVPVLVGDALISLSEIHISEIPVANLGTGGLRGLQLHIDWENERFALTGRAEPTAVRRPMRTMVAGEGPRFGLRAMPSGGAIEVAGTDPGSAAEAIGLLSGDRIVAINGKSTTELEFAQVRQELTVEALELTVERDGETILLKRPG